MRAKRFTKTIAFRVTEQEWEVVQWMIANMKVAQVSEPDTYGVFQGRVTPSVVIRGMIKDSMHEAMQAIARQSERQRVEAEEKRAERAARRAAKKAAPTDAV